MTVLIDARPLTIKRPGGITKVIAELLPPLLESLRGHRVILGTTGWQTPNLSEYTTSPHIIHRHLRAPNKVFTLLTITNLSSFDRFFAKEKPDHLLLFNLGHIGTPQIPYDLVVHDLALFIEPRWFPLRSRGWRYAVHGETLTKNARHLFAVSESTKQSLQSLLRIPQERITFLPFGKPLLADSEPLPEVLQNKKYLLVLGGNDPRKNVDNIITVFQILKKDPTYKDLLLVVTGTPSTKQIADMYVIDRPSDGLLRSLFEHTALFLYPSWYEGFGIPLHEAATFQKPCLASTAGALPETAPHGTLFAAPAKPQHWLQNIKLILQNPSPYQTLSTLKHETWKKSAELLSKPLISP